MMPARSVITLYCSGRRWAAKLNIVCFRFAARSMSQLKRMTSSSSYCDLTAISPDGATISVVNAGATTYPDGWKDYRAVASVDRRTWVRLPTTFDGQAMTIRIPPAPGPTYVAYFEP